MQKFFGLIFGGAVCCAVGVAFVVNATQNQAVPEKTGPGQVPQAQVAKVVPVLAMSGPGGSLSAEDEPIFKQVMATAIAQNWQQKPMGEIVQAIAEQFIGTPYQEGLLDQTDGETLVTSLREFDCVLLIESVLAMARGIATADTTPQAFVARLKEQRYAGGGDVEYCNRLHYFSHWIDDNQRRSLVQDLTGNLNGTTLNKSLTFMSSHWQDYPKMLKSSEKRYCIDQMEAKLKGANVRYLPTAQIEQHYAELKPGDVVAIATELPGLDVTHTGLIYRTPEGGLGLIHAAPGGVKVSPDLASYVSQVESSIGILVARPNDPRSAK